MSVLIKSFSYVEYVKDQLWDASFERVCQQCQYLHNWVRTSRQTIKAAQKLSRVEATLTSTAAVFHYTVFQFKMMIVILLCLISLAVAAPLFQQDEVVENHLSVEAIVNSHRSPRDLRQKG